MGTKQFHLMIFKVGHSHDDVVEVNGFDLRMLPGSFLYGKEPGYKANVEVMKSYCGVILSCLVGYYKGFLSPFLHSKGKKTQKNSEVNQVDQYSMQYELKDRDGDLLLLIIYMTYLL